MHTIYLVPHTHYDAVWAFTQDDYTYINELILTKAVELMKQSDFKFIIEQTFILEELEHINPKLWLDIKEMIQGGKLEIVDGQYLMPDPMLPDGEVLVREILVGKRYCKEKFGVDVPVAWAADGFGLNAQIPQIYKKAGYKWLAFRRGANKRISEFYWKGLDGTKILSHFMPLGYRAALNLDEVEDNFKIIRDVSASSHILMPSGSGVTIPQEETMEFVEKWNKTHKDVKIRISTASEFFENLESENLKLKTMKGEMYSGRLSEVFPDVCSSRIWIIMNTRKCENLMFCAERFATLAWTMGYIYPEISLKNSWKKLLFIAFHDVLPGTSIDEVYNPVKDHFVALERDLTKVINDSLIKISSRINTGGESIVVFNPLTWDVTNWVEVDLSFNRGSVFNPSIKDKKEVENELLEVWRYSDGSINHVRIGFIASVPALGYKSYKIIERKKKREEALEVDSNVVENQYFRLTVNGDNGIIEIKTKDNNLEVRGNELVLEDEAGDLYYHKGNLPVPIKTESGGGLRYGAFKPKKFKIVRTPLRTKIIFENELYTLRWPYRLLEKHKPLLYRHKSMDIRKEVIIYKDLQRIDFITTIDNKYPYVRMRVKFDVNIDNSNYFRGTQFGVTEETTIDKINLPRDSVELFSRAPAIKWVDYSDDKKGLTLINDGNPENELKTGSISMTLFRGISCLSSDGESGPMIPTPDALELKEYTFKYAVYPHSGDWKDAKSYRYAQEYSRPLIPIQIDSKGDLPNTFSFLKIEPDNLVLSAFKKAEDSDDVILRFYETAGELTDCKIKTFFDVQKLLDVNLLEDEEENKGREPDIDSKTIQEHIKPYEIKNIKLKFQK